MFTVHIIPLLIGIAVVALAIVGAGRLKNRKREGSDGGGYYSGGDAGSDTSGGDCGSDGGGGGGCD